MLDLVRKLIPKHSFFSLFVSGKGKSMRSSLTNDEHLKGLLECEKSYHTDNTHDINNTEPIYDELDNDINSAIRKTIHNLKTNMVLRRMSI